GQSPAGASVVQHAAVVPGHELADFASLREERPSGERARRRQQPCDKWCHVRRVEYVEGTIRRRGYELLQRRNVFSHTRPADRNEAVDPDAVALDLTSDDGGQ